jgi:hypothetical protein
MKPLDSIIEHSHMQYQGLQLSTKEFYQLLQTALEDKRFPGVRFRTAMLGEGGLFSPQREYFFVDRRDLQFVVCAAPFGRDFFFSWYLKRHDALSTVLMETPLIGRWLNQLLSPRITYYRYDTVIMFKESIKQVVAELLAELEKDKGARKVGQRVSELLPA